MDGLTFALALVGAVTGVASAVAQGVQVYRERPRLRLNFGTTEAIGQRPSAWIDVHNDAPRATTVREVGFFAKPVRVEITSQDDDETYRAMTAGTFPLGGPAFLEAGETRRFVGVPDTISQGIHADLPLRVYATDAHNRKVWGDADRIVRMLIGHKPPLRPEDSEGLRRLLEPSPERRLPTAVEPRWKLWKRRELRKPSAWRE